VALLFGFDHRTGAPKFLEVAAPPNVDEDADLTKP
jgi:hypothetical protein